MFSKNIKIKNKILSIKNKPMLVAELSANHNGSFKIAKKTILSAKKNHILVFSKLHTKWMRVKSLNNQFSLAGNADQILNRVTKICINQIVKLDKQTNIVTYKQIGKKTHFKRIKYHEMN